MMTKGAPKDKAQDRNSKEINTGSSNQWPEAAMKHHLYHMYSI
jgi:hypothetical protein